MSYSERSWLTATKHAAFCNAWLHFRLGNKEKGFVLTHLTVIAFHMIVFVHGYDSNGFIRPL